jgi:hypothetical protein
VDDLETIKQFLGPLAEKYADSELRQLHYEMREMAELLLDIYFKKKSHKRIARAQNDDFDTPAARP